MSEMEFSGEEKRAYVRLDYVKPLAYKVCNKETISKILKGYISNISQSGVLCYINHIVNIDDILWLSFDRATLDFCREIERNCLVYQGGIVAKVVRLELKTADSVLLPCCNL